MADDPREVVCVQKADGSGFTFSPEDAAQFLKDHADEGYSVVDCAPEVQDPAGVIGDGSVEEAPAEEPEEGGDKPARAARKRD